MSEINDPELTNSNNSPDEHVGDIIRKARISRRITIETIAKDLKLNMKYIKAIEAGDYDSLPAAPYIRVYLRSLAKYLNLDPNEILEMFYKERGIRPEHEEHEGTQKIEITMDKKESHNPWISIGIIVIVLLTAFIFIAKTQGWLPGSSPQTQTTPIGTDTLDTDTTDFIDDTLQDSIISEDTVSLNETDTIDSIVKASVESEPAENRDPMHLHIQVVKDSVWMHVFSDGETWINTINKGQIRKFTAYDSFNVHVGNNNAIRYKLNGESFTVRGRKVVTFKVDRSGVEKWPLSKWNSVFKNRLD